MNKIDFRFSKKQALLFSALVALTGFGGWSVAYQSSQPSKAAVDSSKRVTEQVVQEPTSSIAPVENNSAAAEQTPVSVTAEAPVTPEPTIYEKYDVSESAMLPFINAYPDYFAVNNDAFIRDVSSIVKKYPNNGAQRLEAHRRISGFMIPSDSPNHRQAEKNSFMQLIINEVPTSSEYWFTAL